jgi:hypothetical protein
MPIARDAWIEVGELCPECGRIELRPAVPLVIEWEPGSDKVGDFSYVNRRWIVKEAVIESLRKHFRGFESGPLEMIERPGLRRPKRATGRNRRIWLPYDGPPLAEFVITAEVSMAPCSTVKTELCSNCGRDIDSEVIGIEEISHRYDKKLGHVVPYHKKRVRGQGLFACRADLGESDFFRFRDWGFYCCTERAKYFIEAQGFSGVQFEEVGDVIE